MELSTLVPAGVPRRLSRLKRRIGAIVSEGPLLFLGVVLAVALLFRIVVGLAKG